MYIYILSWFVHYTWLYIEIWPKLPGKRARQERPIKKDRKNTGQLCLNYALTIFWAFSDWTVPNYVATMPSKIMLQLCLNLYVPTMLRQICNSKLFSVQAWRKKEQFINLSRTDWNFPVSLKLRLAGGGGGGAGYLFNGTYMMTFRKLRQKKHAPTLFTDWHSKKYSGTFRNQAQTPYTLFLDPNSTLAKRPPPPRVLFEILDKNRPPTLNIHEFYTPIAFLYIKSRISYENLILWPKM